MYVRFRLPEFEQSDLGFCQHYRGVACSQLIGNKTVYVKATMTLNQMEEKLAAIFTILATGKVRKDFLNFDFSLHLRLLDLYTL